MKTLRSSVLLLMACILILSGCQSNGSGGAENNDKLKVVATIAQIGEPLNTISGDLIEVTSLMGPGVDPHLYQATTGDISKLDQSDAIFYNGLHLEANMLAVFDEMSKSKPVLALGETLAEDRLLKDETGAIDPHIWFDIDLWQAALEAAVDQLIELVPEHKEQLIANRDAYFAQLAELKQESSEKLAAIPEEQRILVTAHDAFGYFGAANGLQVVGLQGLSTEDEIGLSDIEDTIDLLIEYQVPAVFIESSINPDSINAVIEGAKRHGLEVALGGELFSDAMGASGTVEGTYLGMYAHNVETISSALLDKGEE